MEVAGPTDSADAAAPNCARGNIPPGMHAPTQLSVHAHKHKQNHRKEKGQKICFAEVI